ncbi:carbohydrate ABC transporter permease [Streptomyces sp. NPDC056730]|uniref:carbohydrate ABC transporter permease n=1 Tax=Streptomyces sp. NPDC056730 TaxID=3345929 RepID=UPI003689BB90
MTTTTESAADAAPAPAGASPPTSGAKGREPRSLGVQNLAGWLFSTPFLVLFSVFMAFPIVATLAMSFTDFGLRNVTDPLSAEFIGFENYTKLFGDEKFLKALFNTAYFVVVGVPLTIGAGLAAAVLLNSGIDRARTLFRVGFYAPVVTSIVAVAVVWTFVLDPSEGLIAGLASEVGLTTPDFLGSEALAMPSLILMAVWRNLGTVMVLFIAGLQAIPADVREAARLDGAGRRHLLRHVILPAVTPVIVFLLLWQTINALQVFDLVYVTTKGGPLGSTTVIVYFIWEQAFKNFTAGYGAAAAYALALALLLIAAVPRVARGVRSRRENHRLEGAAR